MGNIARFRWRHALILGMDLVWVHVSLIFVFWMYVQFHRGENSAYDYSYYPWMSLTAFIIFYLFGLYQASSEYWHSVFIKSALSIVALSGTSMLLSNWIPSLALPNSVYLGASAVQIASITLFHISIGFASRRWIGRKNVLIIGETGQIGNMLEQKLGSILKRPYIVHDFIHTSGWKENLPRLASADVILMQSDFAGKDEVMNYCALMKKEVLLVPELPELFILNADVQHFDDLLVLSIKAPQLNLIEKTCKRLTDIFLSLLMLVLTSPMFIVLFIVIPLNSRGPALFRQTRSGLNGKEFEIYKFRSMVQDAETLSGPELAKSNDPRITSVGKFIRATRLDELPQLINVLRGDMSLIGPRPERPFFVKQFIESIPTYTYRMSVRPGITGLAQIMGKYSTSAEDKHRFDLMYIREYSFLLDIKILLQTIFVILSKEQAAGVQTLNALPSLQKSVNEL